MEEVFNLLTGCSIPTSCTVEHLQSLGSALEGYASSLGRSSVLPLSAPNEQLGGTSPEGSQGGVALPLPRVGIHPKTFQCPSTVLPPLWTVHLFWPTP